MKPISLTLSLFAIFAVFTSCKKEPCVDAEAFESLRQEMVQWYPDTTNTRFVVADRNSITQSMSMQYYYFDSQNIYTDDCGNSYGQYNLSLWYQTSVSPFSFTVNVRGSGNPNDGFYIEIMYNRYIGQYAYRMMQYDLNTKTSRQSDVIVTETDTDSLYGKVLEIQFLNVEQPTQIEKIWYSETYGLYRFADQQGNEYTVLRFDE